jgi:hypothetical protein
MQQRYAVEFGADRDTRIEIVYWIDEQGNTAGEAYFRRDDFCAPISKGDFAHPFTRQQYKLHVPTGSVSTRKAPAGWWIGRFGKSNYAILDVLVWKNVGFDVPKACPTCDPVKNSFV